MSARISAEPPVLEITGLGVRRDGETVLEGVDLSVDAGSLRAVVGPNGGGKSTLLAAILGQIPFTGSIAASWRRGGKIGFVPQSFPVDRTVPLSVLDFLALTRQRRPVALGVARRTRDRVAGLLAQVALPGFENRLLSDLSGGELRRVLLAEAIDPAPELLLLDEPGTGMDEESSARLEATLAAMRAPGETAILMVSHDFAAVRRLADRVTVLDRSVRQEGTPAEILPAALTRDGREPGAAVERSH